MILKDPHSTLSSNTFKPQKVVSTLLIYVLILIFIYLSSKTGKVFNSVFFYSVFNVSPNCFKRF